MANTLLKKLRIKPGFTVNVINAPENFPNIVGPVPPNMFIKHSISAAFDALLIFATTQAEMLQALDLFSTTVDEQMVCWICYPKIKSKLASDLNLMQSWESLNHYQLTPCASAAIDDTWTAIRIKPANATKKSGLGNADIQANAYGKYIDVANKTVTLPEDFKAELQKAPQTLAFYEQLPYSNRKEYVLWILSAKQEKTRLERISKAREKLAIRKKNPSEK